MVIKSNSVRDINVALLELERRIKTNKDEDDSTLQEAVNYVKKYLNNHLNDGSTYNINISGNANTADYAISAGSSNYATSAGSAQSADTATNANHATNADYATSAGSATNADYATSAGTAADATHATNADYATTAGSAAIAFPPGFIYFQLYNPNTASWESSPNDLNLQVPSGYKWTEITSNFASYPYMKIGSGTTQSGKVLNHTHGMQHHHSMRHRHSGTTGGASMYGGWSADSVGFWYNIGGSGSPSIYNLSSANYRSGTATINHNHGFTTSNNTGSYADTENQESRFTSGAYSGTGTGTTGKTATDGNASANTTNEVNASNVKVWKVVQDV